MKHSKKILPEYFESITDGSKTFEIRKEDDCRYEVGDLIELFEVNQVGYVTEHCTGSYVEIEFEPTGRKQLVEITYRLESIDFSIALKDSYVVLGIKLRVDKE